jgi:hypothetical protein
VFHEVLSNAGCYLSQNLFSSHVPPKNAKIKLYRSIILSVIRGVVKLGGEKHKLRLLENRVVRRRF